MSKTHVKKGDQVKVIAGNHKGKTGTVTLVNAAKNTVVVEGVRPVLTDLKRVSKPGRRQYVGAGEVPRVMSGLGISILSTPKGVLSGGSAKRQNVGGELLATVW